ncbi:hypothetical protein O0L34_g1530 [Tuta absoluta]|nr:hypothetical protein O0L34_g1530 [Tuta absoluta]
MIFWCIAILLLIGNVSTGFQLADLLQGTDDLGDSDSSSQNRQEARELDKFFKYLSKKERSHYKKKFRKEVLKDEEDQEKFFENLLGQVKKLGQNPNKLEQAFAAVNKDEKKAKIMKMIN